MIRSVSNFIRKGAQWIRGKRNYDAAATNRLTMDWIVGPLSADASIVGGQLATMRNRSRDLERNNEWARGFLRILENNVLGEKGILMQMRVTDPSGRPDRLANKIIEDSWRQWTKVGTCTIDKKSSWRDVQRLALRTMARDGEALIRKVRTKLGLRLQLLEPDLLDVDCNEITTGGNEIRFGVEFDADRAVVAFWMLSAHPGDSFPIQQPGRRRTRVPVEDIIHLFLPDRIAQTRGNPWLVASMKGLRMLEGYSEAELVAARTAAAKMGFFTKKTPEGWTGSDPNAEPLTMNAAPGVFEELPEGYDFKEWDPKHPNSAYPEFVKSRLRGVATSLGISYNTLSSDLEGVNYSSIRAGLLEEREVWKAVQRFLIEHLCEPIFTEWLDLELLRGALPLPYTKLAKFNAPEFHGRRWPWVDPLKDVQASKMAIDAGLTSQRKVVAENAGDIEDVFQDQAADAALASSLGLSFPPLKAAPGGKGGTQPPPDGEED